MTPTVVWFNQHLSNTWHALRAVREVQRPGEFRLLCTHRWRHYPGRKFSDYFEPEPAEISDADYVEFCLEFARNHAVELFYPWRRVIPILKARERFAQLGTRLVVVADVDTLRLLGSKVEQYRALGPGVAPLPEFEVVNTLAQFEAAYARLRDRGWRVCYKPAVSIFGFGFHILTERESPRGNSVVRTVAEARRALAARQQPFADLLLMPYLPGPERSIDCLADQGHLVRCVIRRKSMRDHHAQTIEHNPAIEEVARRITAKLRLNAVFNIQLRNDGDTPYLLEVNPRMSGGIPAACTTGLVLPYWALRLALGTARPEEVPHPLTGIRVNSADYPGSR
jgi:biotin carboxylase